MSNNPYQSPIQQKGQPRNPQGQAEGLVNGPAVALIIVAAISAVLLAISFVINLFLLLSGAVAVVQNDLMDGTTVLTVRCGIAALVFVTNAITIYGAIQMKNLRNYSMAKTAAVLSVIPCLSPCYFLGIPFGIWALVTLNNPDVRRRFQD